MRELLLMSPQPGSSWRSLVPRSLEARLLALTYVTLVIVGAVAQLNDWRTYITQTDFSAYYLAGRALNHGAMPYDDDAREQLGDMLPPEVRHARIPYVYPPPFAAFIRIPALIPYWWLTPFWLAANASILVLAYRLIWRLYARQATVTTLVVLSLLAPASLQTLSSGQVNGVILLCLATALWRVARQDRPFVAGALLGVPAVMKLFPAALIAGLPRPQMRRAAMGLLVVAAVLSLAGLAAGGGVRAFAEWPRAVQQAAARFPELGANQSLSAVLHRLTLSWPAIHGVTLRRAILAGSIAVAAVSGLVALMVPRRRPARIDIGLRWSVLILAACIAMPFSWDSYYVFLVLPVAILLVVGRPASGPWRTGAAGLLFLIAHRYTNVVERVNHAVSAGLGLTGCVLLWLACVVVLCTRARQRRPVVAG